MRTPVDGDKSCIYNVMLWGNSKKYIQRITIKHITINKNDIKNVWVSHKKAGKKREMKEMKNKSETN